MTGKMEKRWYLGIDVFANQVQIYLQAFTMWISFGTKGCKFLHIFSQESQVAQLEPSQTHEWNKPL